MLPCLFIATTHQSSMSIYSSEQENTKIKNVEHLTIEKTSIRRCFDQFGLAGLPVTLGITSGRKKVLKDAKKNRLENRTSKRTQETAMPLKTSIHK